jgi:hypothetical protein
MWTIPTLNTRETATIFWFAVLAVGAVTLIPSVRTTALRVVKAAVSGHIRWLALASLVYVTAVIVVLDRIGYWRSDMLGETLFWLFGGAALAMPRVISLQSVGFKVVLRQLFAISAGLEFIANVHTYPLPVEVALEFLVATLGAMSALANIDPNLKDAAKPLAAVTSCVVVAILGSSVIYVFVHLARFETAEYLRALLLPLMLTVAVAPLVYALRLIILWQSTFSMLNYYLSDRPELNRYIRRRSSRLCGLSLRRAGPL